MLGRSRRCPVDAHLKHSVSGIRGQIYRLTQRYDQALADFNQAIELGPGYAWAIGRRGRTHWQMKRYGEAVADLKRLPRLIWSQASQ